MPALPSGVQQRMRLPLYIARHPANKGHVPSALLRAARFQLTARVTRKPALVRLGSLQMWVHIGNAAATKVVYGSPPDWAEMQAWRALLRPGDLFVDVGSNVGTYALWASSCGASVIAVEPDPGSATKIRANVALNPGVPIEVVEAALSDQEGTASFSVGLDSENHLGSGKKGERRVPTTTLDRLVAGRRVAGVKLDVEGFEETVLAGASEVLRERSVKAFQIEWNSACEDAVGHTRDPIVERLTEHGYEFFRPDNSGTLHRHLAPDYGADVFAMRSGDAKREGGRP